MHTKIHSAILSSLLQPYTNPTNHTKLVIVSIQKSFNHTKSLVFRITKYRRYSCIHTKTFQNIPSYLFCPYKIQSRQLLYPYKPPVPRCFIVSVLIPCLYPYTKPSNHTKLFSVSMHKLFYSQQYAYCIHAEFVLVCIQNRSIIRAKGRACIHITPGLVSIRKADTDRVLFR